MAQTGKYRRRRGVLGTLLVWLRNLAIVAAVAVVGAKFYADYKLETKLDQLSGMVAPVGTLTIGDSSTGFDGTVSVNTISFIPDPGVDIPPVTMDSAVLHTPGLLWTLGLGRNSFPNTMGLTLSGMRAEIGGLMSAESRSAISGLSTETLACGDVTYFETVDLNNMGFEAMASSVDGRYNLKPPNELDLQIVVQNSNAAEVHMELALVIENFNDVRAGAAPPESTLKSVGVTLHSAEFNRRRNAYCASQDDISSDEFIDNHVAAVVDYAEKAGVELSDELIYQYRRFAEGEGVWTFLSRPDRPLDMQRLASAQTPLDILSLLNVNSAIASGVPQPLVISPIVVESNLITTVDEEGNQVVQQINPKVWKPVEPSSLGSHIGRNVRINSKFGKEYTGRLVNISDGNLLIDTLLTGGSAQIPIPLDQIFKARVLTRD